MTEEGGGRPRNGGPGRDAPTKRDGATGLLLGTVTTYVKAANEKQNYVYYYNENGDSLCCLLQLFTRDLERLAWLVGPRTLEPGW